MADAFIRQLAQMGHQLHVAVCESDIKNPYSSNVTLHKIETGGRSVGLAARVRFASGAHEALKKLVRRGMVDVVHQLNPVVTGLSLPFWNCSRPVVLGPYVPDWPLILYNGRLETPRMFDRVKIRAKREVWQLQHRIASAIILSSPAALGKIRDHARYKSKTHVIPYGVDIDAFYMSPISEQKVILFVGSLMQHKGVFVLLEAFRQVQRAFPDCKLLLAGVGSEEERARSVAATLQDPTSVEFLGRVAHEDLPELMQRCSVFCIPSFGEAFGLVALEAMASGRPVVGTDASGLGYLIPDQGGQKVPVGDIDKLAQGLISILNDPARARSMGEYNRQLVERQYAWPRVIERLEDVYISALTNYKEGVRNG